MSAEVVLLLLRIFGAGLLLAFMGLLVWLTARDLSAVGAAMQRKGEAAGTLVVVADKSGQMPDGQRFPLLPVTSIGRAPSKVVVLDDGFQHLRLKRDLDLLLHQGASIPLTPPLGLARESAAAGRFADPGECGDLVAYLCSAQAGFMTAQNIVNDGGVHQGLF